MAISIYGEDEPAEEMHPSELPEAGMLIMDCEGAEKEILESDADFPNRIVVESRGVYNAPTHLVERLLSERDFNVEKTGIENLSEDVQILVADRSY